jgi:hypothetical protein
MELDRDNIPDSDAEYLIQIPASVLESPFRCLRCRSGQTAHQSIDRCIATTVRLVELAVQQKRRIAVCSVCEGPLVHALKVGKGARCLRCGYRRESGGGRRATGFGSAPKCKGCGKQFSRPKSLPKTTQCQTCRRAARTPSEPPPVS